MGTRGPAPVPTKVLQMRGSWRAKTRTGEPIPKPGKPRCPDWLTPNAKAIWKSLTTELAALGLLTKIDAFALTRYCIVYARWREAEEWIALHGTTYTRTVQETIFILVWPHVHVAESCLETLHKIEQTFGMSPSARARLATLNGALDATQEPSKDPRRFLTVS